MGQKIIIDLEAKTDKAVKEIADLKKEIQKLNKEVAESNKDTAQGLGNIEKSSNQAVKGIRKMGTTLKAGIFGLLVLAFKEI